MNRKLIASCCLAVGLLVGAIFIIANRHRSEINLGNFHRIKKGMTEEEVDAILGGPERDETNGAYHPGAGLLSTGSFIEHSWMSRDGYISVGFNKDGKVCAMLFDHVGPLRPPTWEERIKAWLGWKPPKAEYIGEDE